MSLCYLGICPTCHASYYFLIGDNGVVCCHCGAEEKPEVVFTVDIDLNPREW